MSLTLIIVIGIILLFGVLGYFRGVINMVISLVSIAVIMVATVLLAPRASAFIESNTNWKTTVEEKTQGSLSELGLLKDSTSQIDLDDLPITDGMKEKLRLQVDSATATIAESYNSFIVTSVTNIIFNALVYIAVFLVISLAITIVALILRGVSKIPAIKVVNRFLGLVVGLVLSLLVIWFLMVLVTAFASSPFPARVLTEIAASPFLTFLYDNNIVMAFL